MPATGYEVLGFPTNPFNSNTAEREPEIAAYAVHPPYLDRTEQASIASGAFFLEGARGSGKSATRLTVAKDLFRGPGGPLIIPLTSFNVFRPYARSGIPIELYAVQIAFLAVETLIAWMTSLTEDEQRAVTERVRQHEALVSKFVSNFYLNRSDHSRSGSAKDVYELLETSTVARATIWMEKRWDQVTGVVAQLASSFAKKYADFDISDPTQLQKLLERQRGDGFHDPMYTLIRTVEVARAFGFTGVLVQIDKVDETDWTGADTAAAAELILPLLANINLHEIEGLTWTFFIWDEVSQGMRKTHGAKIRFDKIPHGEISWEAGYLSDLVARRMAHFSGGTVTELSDISEQGADISTVLPQLIELTARSPRQLISALDHILSTHIQRFLNAPRKLTLDSYQQGMDTYALKSLGYSGLLDEARTIAKLGNTKFVTRDVQGLIRQSQQTARGRIDTWIAARLVRQCGTRPTGGAGRPVDEFEISDPRVRRVLERQL
jgi:hypothetical protein